MGHPVQQRSRRTLAAILDAAESLLAHRPFDEISVAEIILKSGSSTGSFYARFESKDALLAALYRRYHDELPARVAALRAAAATELTTLRQTCERIVAEFSVFFIARPNLMRAIVIYARTRPHEIKPLLADRASFHRELVALFEPFHRQIVHADPRAAVKTGLFFTAAALREGILFADAPFAALTDLAGERLQGDAAMMLFAFLTTPMEA